MKLKNIFNINSVWVDDTKLSRMTFFKYFYFQIMLRDVKEINVFELAFGIWKFEFGWSITYNGASK